MPDAPQPIDWPGLRANAVHMGIRGAARAASVAMSPEDQERFVSRVRKRAEREGWEDKRIAAKAAATLSRAPASYDVANVATGQDSACAALADDERETRLSLSRTARRLARETESKDILIETPADVLSVAKLYAVTHRIDQDKGGPRLVLNQFNVQLGIEPTATDI